MSEIEQLKKRIDDSGLEGVEKYNVEIRGERMKTNKDYHACECGYQKKYCRCPDISESTETPGYAKDFIMNSHNLKTDSEVFQAVADGIKTYEIRFDDRGFAVGDELVLMETKHTGQEMKAGKPLIFTGNEVEAIVRHKLKDKYGLQPGWCILSIEVCSVICGSA